MPRVRRTVRALSGLLALAGAAPALAAAPGPPETTITAKALLKDVEALASPRYGGHLAGIPGYEEAARWAAKRFEKLGLRPGGEDGYLQRLPLEFNAIEGDKKNCPRFVTRSGEHRGEKGKADRRSRVSQWAEPAGWTDLTPADGARATGSR